MSYSDISKAEWRGRGGVGGDECCATYSYGHISDTTFNIPPDLIWVTISLRMLSLNDGVSLGVWTRTRSVVFNLLYFLTKPFNSSISPTQNTDLTPIPP